MMEQARSGDTVKVNYTGRLDDGEVFASSGEQEPLEFVIGKNRMISGFEEAVVGMSPGESKTAKIPADKAFGPHRADMLKVVERSQCPTDVARGQRLEVTDQSGRTTIVKVSDVSESEVTLDINHPLAGKDLTFDIELVDIV
jgi:peptidylprolyl isomerase